MIYTVKPAILIFTFFIVGCFAVPSAAQDTLPFADTLLARSIAYHDPGGIFMERVHRLQLRETRPDAPDRQTIIKFNGPGTELYLSSNRDGHAIEGKVDEAGCSVTLDGSASIPDSLAERYRLTCEGLTWIRDYYAYLFALPMKLHDPGTHLAPEATMAQFQGEQVYRLDVTYDAEVGTDNWMFYLNPETYALVGYQFYRGDDVDNGEYIVLKGEVKDSGIRLPRKRSWYITEDDRLLGTDIIERYEVVSE